MEQMRGLSTYSVEPISKEKQGQSTELIHVEAQSPTQAAEKVLGERVSSVAGDGEMRCRVWWLDDQFRTNSLTLYTPG